jgi:hypothetical protein
MINYNIKITNHKNGAALELELVLVALVPQ